MELSTKEIDAVKDSIFHWKNDIEAELMKGRKMRGAGCSDAEVVFKDNLEIVECYTEHCPLCMLSEDDCSICPYKRKYGITCEQGAWGRFEHNPNLKTCQDMIRSLEKILESDPYFNKGDVISRHCSEDFAIVLKVLEGTGWYKLFKLPNGEIDKYRIEYVDEHWSKHSSLNEDLR